MGINVAADPSLVWISDQNEDPELITRHLFCTISWLKAIQNDEFQVSISPEEITQLYQLNIVPNEKRLQQLILDSDNDDTVSAKELAKLINELIISSLGIENDIDYNANIIETTLNFGEISNNNNLCELSKASFLRFLISLHFLKQVEHYALPRLSTSPLSTKSHIKVEMLICDHCDAVEDQDLELERNVFSDRWSLYSTLDAQFLWDSANDTKALKRAVLVKAASQGLDEYNLRDFDFGDAFFKSARDNGAISGPIKGVSLSKILEIVSNPDTDILKPFRTGKSPASSVRTRPLDNAEARRVHLTGGHEGFRLMLWEKSDGSFEFANIGPKSELEICQ